jgi:2'-5' RNA ligase
MSDQKIRCFIAVKVPQHILEEIDNYLMHLRRIASDVRWVKVHGIHVTLKFLGEIEPKLVDQVKNSLISITGVVEPFHLSVQGSGCFPNTRKPRVFWLGLQQNPENDLFRIYKWIENKLDIHGFEREKRKFSPHLTVGRVRKEQNFAPLFDYIKKNPFSKSSFQVNSIVFMRSILKPSGAEYELIEEYKL